MKKICLMEECIKPHHSKGYCEVHYRRFVKHGDPHVKKPPGHKKTIPIIERLNKNSIPIPESGCLIWIKHWNRSGYGIIKVNHKTLLCHRVAWRSYNGLIPVGLDVLHKCDTPSCINPKHLFLGTQIDNIKDMVSKGRQRAPKGPRKIKEVPND